MPRRYVALLVAFGLLYVWRMSGVAPVGPITAHLSNLYLTGAALTLVAGPRAFGEPGPWPRRVVVAAALLAAVNVGGEILLALAGLDDEVNRAMGGVNTSDPVDGLVGLAAIGGVLALLPRRDPAA